MMYYGLYSIHSKAENDYKFAQTHRRRKGWGYGTAAPPDFKSAP